MIQRLLNMFMIDATNFGARLVSLFFFSLTFTLQDLKFN